MRQLLLISLIFGCNDRAIGPIQASSEPLCHFDEAKGRRAVLASAGSAQLQLIHADGSRSTPWLFGPADATNVFNQSLAARSGYVAAAASWVRGDLQAWSQDLVFIAPDETVLWHGTSTGTAYPQLFLNRAGWLAAAVAPDGFVVDPQGHARTLTGLQPLAEPTEDGSVLVRGPMRGGEGGPVGWLRSGGNQLEPLSHSLTDAWATPVMVSGRAVYVAEGPVLVIERPGDARTVSLPGLDATMAGIIDQVDSGWVLIGGDWRTPRYLVNARTLEARPIGMSTPDGFRPFMGALYGARLDTDGALLMGLRDDYSGALYRYDSTSWQRIGGTVTNVLDINALARGGTYLISATNSRYSFEEWPPAPPNQKPDYDGDSLQVVRPQSGVSRALQLAQMWTEINGLELSSDGRCVAYWDGGEQPTLTAYDVERDRKFPLGTAEIASTLVWIE